MTSESFSFSQDERRSIAEADEEEITYRLPLGGEAPDFWIEVICHEWLHSVAAKIGGCQPGDLEDGLIEEILEYTGLVSWQLRESGALEPEEEMIKIWR